LAGAAAKLAEALFACAKVLFGSISVGSVGVVVVLASNPMPVLTVDQVESGKAGACQPVCPTPVGTNALAGAPLASSVALDPPPGPMP
jgi:hypothetical protein